MHNRNRLVFNFADHSLTFWIQKDLINLWLSVSGSRLLEGARKEIIEFVQNLPMHARRKETEEEFITRHLLNEIEKRARHKWKVALNTFPPAYLTDAHIRNEVWDMLKGTRGLGGFSNSADGIYAAYFSDEDVDFIYHFHDRPISPECMHENSNLMTVVYKDVVVFVEYSCAFFNGVNSPQKLETIVEAAIRNRMGE